MQIDEIEYHDKETGWSLASTKFFPDLTLLVGMSGVGKTKILEAIRTLRRIIRRSDSPPKVWGTSWSLKFVVDGVKYLWEAEYEAKPEIYEPSSATAKASHSDDDDDITTGPKVLSERLLTNDKEIIKRDAQTIYFDGNPTPKLSPFKSAVALLGEEQLIKPVIDAIGHVAFISNIAPEATGPMIDRFDMVCKRHANLQEIREGDLPTYVKLAILFETDEELFRQIVNQFREVFPLVEDVKFERVPFGPFWDVPDLRIKEAGIEKWIPERQISSGMLRTLMHLASVVLWPDESVILIDEFENSLGVNCLDHVTRHMMGHRKHLQFIVTSHHPYIINNIPPSNWKVVIREGAEVTTVNAADAGIGKSRHEAFFQLISSDLYQNGVTAQ